MEQQTQEVIQEAPQQEETLRGEFVLASSQKERIFVDLGSQSAYSQMLELLSWVKPKDFKVVCGTTQDGKTAVKINYIK